MRRINYISKTAQFVKKLQNLYTVRIKKNDSETKPHKFKQKTLCSYERVFTVVGGTTSICFENWNLYGDHNQVFCKRSFVITPLGIVLGVDSTTQSVFANKSKNIFLAFNIFIF